MKNILLFYFFLLLSKTLLAQSTKCTIHGFVKDSVNGETLLQAYIKNTTNSSIVLTNNYGFFSLNVSSFPITLGFSYVGYKYKEIVFEQCPSEKIDIMLSFQDALNEVVITERKREAVSGVMNISIEKLKSIPSIAGEADVIKALAYLPGVNVGVEGTSGLFVRGGTPDQNLMLLDGSTVYNTSHLFGFLSVFNPNALKNMTFYKGNFPARFGGRLSSIVDLTMKEGNNQKKESELTVGIMSSSYTTEGPIRKNKSSYILSGRAAYLSLLALPGYIKFKTKSKSEYSNFIMGDLNGKINFDLEKNRKLYISSYTGQDAFIHNERSGSSSSEFQLNWGNRTGTLRYTSIPTANLFFSANLNYNYFKYNIDINVKDTLSGSLTFLNQSKVQDISSKFNWDWQKNNHLIRWGAELSQHEFRPNITQTKTQIDTKDSVINGFNNRHFPRSLAIYLEDEWAWNDWTFKTGIRGVLLYTDKVKYPSIEPRIAVNYKFPNTSFIEFAYNRMQQPIHLLNSTGTGFYTNDIWVPATNTVRPQISHQVSAGYSMAIDAIETSFQFDLYYKWLLNQIDYRQGINFLLDNRKSWDKLIEKDGKGRAYGLEIFAKRDQGHRNFTWSYTLAFSYRKFENINQNEWYPQRYDRRHNFAILGEEHLNQKWTFFWNFVFMTGNAVTLPTVLHYDINGEFLQPIYTKRNNARMPIYNRLDIGFSKKYKTKKGFDAKWSFNLYNTYGYRNPFALSYFPAIIYKDPNNVLSGDIGLDPIVKKKTPFRFIPGISYSIKFKK